MIITLSKSVSEWVIYVYTLLNIQYLKIFFMNAHANINTVENVGDVKKTIKYVLV